MGTKRFKDIVGELSPADKETVNRLKQETAEEMISYQLAKLRKQRGLTQADLARALGKTQASISAMENASDNRLSTWGSAIEGMGGRLELTAVFGDERIPIHTPGCWRVGGVERPATSTAGKARKKPARS